MSSNDLTNIYELSGDRLIARADSGKVYPVAIPQPFEPNEFRRLVTAAYVQFIIEGRVTLDGLVTRAGTTPERARVALGASEFREALSHRGVLLEQTTVFTAKQDLLLLLLADPNDGLTLGQKLKKAGVTNTQYQAWMRQRHFAEHVERITEAQVQRSTEALMQLARRANEGDLKAIQLQLEINGRWNPKLQEKIDIMAVMSKVLESLSRHVKDQEALMAVAKDMQQIAVELNLKQLAGSSTDAD